MPHLTCTLNPLVRETFDNQETIIALTQEDIYGIERLSFKDLISNWLLKIN